MFPDELEAAFAACPAVYFAYGLCEPHGPQNALGLDALKAHGLLVRTAREHGGIVAPPDYWHVHEVGRFAIWGAREVGEERPWLTAVPPWVHFKNVCYHLRAAEVLGFHAAILVTGHYGPNWRDLKTLVERIQPYLRMRIHGLPDFEANREGFPGDGADGDHAGKVETSQLWALEPDCVDLSRIPAQPAFPLFAMGKDAALASRRAGEQMVAGIVACLGAKQRELLSAFDPAVPSRLRTFDDVEEFWETAMRPQLAELNSLRGSWTEADGPPAGSRWRTGWLPRRY
ncbi:MAG TPA: creatininase family protein [Thermoanaerobaculia bacterium]|nr:creatininase family protein [Thermoanaerobaculia bacterium]